MYILLPKADNKYLPEVWKRRSSIDYAIRTDIEIDKKVKIGISYISDIS